MLSLLDKIAEWIQASPVAQATGLSVIIAVLRTVYDAKETTWTRIWLEGALCGLLTLLAGSAVKALGLSLEWVLVIGGLIAFMGVAVFRKFLNQWLAKKIGEQNDDVAG